MRRQMRPFVVGCLDDLLETDAVPPLRRALRITGVTTPDLVAFTPTRKLTRHYRSPEWPDMAPTERKVRLHDHHRLASDVRRLQQ